MGTTSGVGATKKARLCQSIHETRLEQAPGNSRTRPAIVRPRRVDILGITLRHQARRLARFAFPSAAVAAILQLAGRGDQPERPACTVCLASATILLCHSLTS